MLRFSLLMLMALFAWSAIGCGGPGKPVNRADELRRNSGSGGSDSGDQGSRERPGSQDPRKKGGDKDGDEADGAEGDKDAEDDAEGDGQAEGEGEGEGDATAEAEPKRRAPAPPRRTASGRVLPNDLGRASGGPKGGRPGAAEKKDKAGEDEEEDVEDSTSDLTDTEAPEKRRYTFYERANQAFATGNETEAFQYLYAHAITEDDALADHPLGWYTGLKEPRVGLRWGVAINYKARKFDGDPPVFDADDEEAANNNSGPTTDGGRDISDRLPGGNRIRGGRRGPTASGPDEDPTEKLKYYTGEYGDLLAKRIEQRRTRSYYGAALNDIDVDVTFEVASGAGNNGRNRPSRNAPGRRDQGSLRGRGGGGGMGTDAPPPDQSANPPASGANNRRGPDTADDGFVPDFEAEPTSIIPGVIMLGTGNASEMLEQARIHGLDLLALFDVSVTVSSRDVPKNTTRLVIYNVKTGDKVVEASPLNNIAYAKAEAGGRDNQIEAQLDKIFQETADKDFKAAAFPEFGPDVAAKRVSSLAGEQTDNPLPPLAEMKYYLENDLISEEDFVAAAGELIGGKNANRLVDSNVDIRGQALKDWLPPEFSIDTSSADFR